MAEELGLGLLNVNVADNKVCSKCKTRKALTVDNFPRNKASKDGFSHWCKMCHSNHRKARKLAVVVGGGATGSYPTEVL